MQRRHQRDNVVSFSGGIQIVPCGISSIISVKVAVRCCGRGKFHQIQRERAVLEINA